MNLRVYLTSRTIWCYLAVLVMGTFSLYIGIAGWVAADFDARLSEQIVEKAGAGHTPPPVPEKTETSPASTANANAPAKNDTRVVYQGIVFNDIASARRYAEEDQINRWFRWVYQVPPGLPLLLTAMAFGVVGGIANLTHKLAGSEAVPNLMLLFKPLFGGLMGLMVFGVATTMPKVFVESANGVRPLSLIFFCLFGGTFSNHVFLWIEEKTKLLLPLGTNPPATNGPTPPIPTPAPKFPPATP